MQITPILLVVLAIIVFTVLWYWKKGLMVTILEAVALVVAIVAAIILTNPVSTALNSATHLDKGISNTILKSISIEKLLNTNDANTPEEYKELTQDAEGKGLSIDELKKFKKNAQNSGLNLDAFKISKEKQKEIVENLPLPNVIKSKVLEVIDKEESGLDLDVFVEKISLSIAKIIVNAICFVLIFIIVMIAWKVVILAFGVVGKLPVIKSANSLGGAAVGVVIGVVRVWILFAIITIFANAAWASKMIEQINNNEILSWIYTNNYIVKFITNIF
jgi:hypothetical protein